MDPDVVYASLDFEPDSDLFDVSIAATAIGREVPLITKDRTIAESGAVDVYW